MNAMNSPTLNGIVRNESPTLMKLLIALLLMAGGCATTKHPAEIAWDEICRNAPHVAGQEIEQPEQRAMNVVGGWDMSVEQVDAICAER
jgi:hypothetical protein